VRPASWLRGPRGYHVVPTTAVNRRINTDRERGFFEKARAVAGVG
jgi:hypothetical protein